MGTVTNVPAQQAPRDLDLFLLIGQSNMAGRGVPEAEDKQPIPSVFMLDKAMQWAPAIDPLHSDKPDIAGVGIGRSFAKELQRQRPGARIGLIPAAFGGTSLEQWKPGGKLYTDAVARCRKAMESGTLRGILWHQGEADSGKPELAHNYRYRWAAFIQQLRADLAVPDVPVVVGQLGEFYSVRNGGKSPYAHIINEHLAMLPLDVKHVAFVSSAGLKDKGDGVHFDTAGLKTFGRRYAFSFLQLAPEWGMR
jgi:hypothetical protein